ncbi:MAG TPA: TonB-dependent receptor [Steroidobacteraceae bacterium]|nr:TonB-dependent receptor [Steroidobacteraceae bacterium]
MSPANVALTFASLLVLVTLSMPKAAADAQATVGLHEIIVTAERRSQDLQQVPMSIAAITTASIAREAITNFFDYANKVPNLSFEMTGDGVGNSRTISIRGISGDGVTGFYIDDTPVPESLDPRIIDISRIEVLRGPQGTLYGARSMAGTVRIITEAPDFERFYGHADASAGDTEHTDRANYTGEAVANIPIIKDRAALRVSGFYDSEAGWLTRSFCTDPATAGITCFPQSHESSVVTTVDNIAATQTYGGAASITFKVNSNLTVTPRVMIQRASYNGFPMADVLTEHNDIGYPYPAGSESYALPPLVPSDLNQGRFFNIAEGGYDDWHLYSLDARWKLGLGSLVWSTAYFDRKVFETEDQTDSVWDTLLPAVAATPGFNLPLPIRSPISELKDYQQFVQEVRFVSALSGPVQFVAGVYYFDLHGAIPIASEFPPALAPGYGALLTAADTCSVVGLCPDPNSPDSTFGMHYRTDSKEPAAYGQVSYQVTHALKATGGVRWSQDQTTSGGYEDGSVVLSPGGPGELVDPNSTLRQDSVTPMAQLQYQLRPDLMVYTMAAKGFRPGGLVPSVPSAICGAELPPGLTVQDTRKFGSDSLWDYEIGTKSDWFDRRLQANADVFYIDWNNIQQVILLPCGFYYRANAGAAVSKGAELELSARPIYPLELSAGIGYNSARITQTSTFSPQRVGDPVFDVPDWTGEASAAWTQELSPQWTVVASVDYAYTGERHSSNNLNSADGLFGTRLLPHYQLVDARLAFDHDVWEFAIVGKNLTNEYADLGDSRSISSARPSASADESTPYGRARNQSVVLRFRWRT